MKNKVMIAGSNFETEITSIIKRVLEHLEDIPIVIASRETPVKNYNPNTYKGDPFEWPPMRLDPIIIIPDVIELKDKKGKPFDEPKSKYINKPIRNYRR